MTNDERFGDDRHREQRELLGSFALGHLDPGERVALQAHLDGCASCQRELAEIAVLVPDLSSLDPEAVLAPAAPPLSLGAEILTVLARERQLRDRRRFRRSVLTAAAVTVGALALASGGYLVGQQGADPRQTAQSGPRPTTSPSPLATPSVPPIPTETIALAPTRPGVSVTDAYLIPHTWGVEVTFIADGLTRGQTYHAAFRLTDGSTQAGGQFLGVGTKAITCNMQSAVLRRDLVRFMILDSSGRVVLTAALPTQNG